MEVILDQKCTTARLRVHKLDSRHPVHRRLFQAQTFLFYTRLLRAHPTWLEGLELVDPLVHPPWQAVRACSNQSICPIKERADTAFQQWANSRPPLSMFLFTNGSQLNDGPTGAGWYGLWGAWRQESARGYLALSKHEVFDAEPIAAYKGLEAVINSLQVPYTQHLYVLLDNQEAAQQLQDHPRGSSQSVIQAFQEAAGTWSRRPT